MPTQLELTAQEKKCRACGKRKPLDDFSPNALGKYGRKSQCKDCENAKRRDQYAADPQLRERISLYHRTKFANDAEYRANVLRQSLRWGRAHPERNRAKTRSYRERHPDKVRTLTAKRNDPQSERYQAWQAVNAAVKRNDFPPAWGLVCDICQEAQAAQYHHWHGYDEQHQLDVIAVCLECHGKEHSIWDKGEAVEMGEERDLRKWPWRN